MSESRAPGLRLQIVLALAGLMLLAFVPLFFAVANLTKATLASTRESAARALGRAIAKHAADAHATRTSNAVARAFEQHAGRDGAEALRIFDSSGHALVSVGLPEELETMTAPEPPVKEVARSVKGAHGHVIDVVLPRGDVVVVARMHVEDDAEPSSPLVGLVALYMTTFALALLTFAYFVLTRLIVRPVDALVQAADRVASGSRSLNVPRAGARELAELGASVQAMATRLIAEEAAMRAKVEELTQATKRLTEAKAQLVRSERLASVGRLAAGVAHEIGNPIAAIMGMEDLLLDGDLKEDEQRDFLQRMKRETERINTVLRDMLDFARPEEQATVASGPLPPADTAEVIDTVIALVRPQKHFKSVSVRTDIEGGPLMVVLPAPRLTQVLLNIVLNAGAAIASRKHEGTVVIRARSLGSRVRIDVEDDGPGIPAGLRESVFDPFMTTKDVGEGTGLGLAVCRGLVEAAGGEIAVDPAYEGGARFVILLPAR